jgi:hypothetical protein
LEVTLGNCTLINEFYVVDITYTHVAIGVQWLYSMGDIHMIYHDMRMEFQDKGGKQVILRGMSIGSPRIVSNQSMEALFRHEDVSCVKECLVTMENSSQDRQHYPTNIQAFLGKHERVFDPLPAGRPPNKGFEHVIELEEGSTPVITTPYRNSKRFKEEIEKAIKELLEMGHIRPSSSPFTS